MSSDDSPGIAASSAGSDGVGLTNTRARLQQLYGVAARLELLAGATGGLKVSIVIPYKPAAST